MRYIHWQCRTQTDAADEDAASPALSQLAALNTLNVARYPRGEDQWGWMDRKAARRLCIPAAEGDEIPCACTGSRPPRPTCPAVCRTHTRTRPSESRCGGRRTRNQRIGTAAQSPPCPHIQRNPRHCQRESAGLTIPARGHSAPACEPRAVVRMNIHVDAPTERQHQHQTRYRA